MSGNAQGTNIVDLNAITPSQTNSHFVKKNGPQQGNLAKRIQVDPVGMTLAALHVHLKSAKSFCKGVTTGVYLPSPVNSHC